MPTPLPRRLLRALVAGALVLLAATATLPTTALATTTPPAIDTADAAGSDLTIQPAVVRAADGRAELDVTLGTDAPDDVVVVPRLAPPEVAADGSVTLGDGTADGTVTRGARLRPGERLRIVVEGITAPVLVVAEAGAADAGGQAPVTPTALVLPGSPGAAPTVTVTTTEDTARVEVRSDAPLLVAVTVAGGDRTTYPDRLVLPDQPLTLTAAAARWPLPTEAAVTDEAGRTVQASTGTTALAVLAAALVAVAGLGLVATRRRVRP